MYIVYRYICRARDFVYKLSSMNRIERIFLHNFFFTFFSYLLDIWFDTNSVLFISNLANHDIVMWYLFYSDIFLPFFPVLLFIYWFVFIRCAYTTDIIHISETLEINMKTTYLLFPLREKGKTNGNSQPEQTHSM